MAYRNFTFELFEEDCVGNDAGKHNFNALSLESQICNLSGEFCGANNLYEKALKGLITQISSLEAYGDLQRYNTVSTAVRTLSSYWDRQEFSIVYPTNLTTYPSISSEDLYKDIYNPTINAPLNNLISLSKSYLTKTFDPNLYKLGTKIHVTMFLYSQSSNLDPSVYKNLIVETYENNVKNFSFNNRYITATIQRNNLYLADSKVLTFINGGNYWAHINTIGPLVNIVDTGKRSSIIFTITSNVKNYDAGTLATQHPNYVPGQTDIIINVNAGIEIGSLSPDLPAMTLANLNNGDTVTLFNYGNIIGAGGKGGTGGGSIGSGSTKGESGGGGGPAITVHVPCIIENHGKIYGGGGGGAGGTGGVTGSNSTGGGGGGGGGVTPGLGGVRGSNAEFKRRNIIVTDGKEGSGIHGGSGGPGIVTPNPNAYKAAGGAGGEMGEPGKNSDSALGGPAGAYVIGNNHVYWAMKGQVGGNVV